MPDRKHYANAPITEAVIDLTVTPGQDFSIEDLEALGDTLANEYPTRTPMYLYLGQMSIEEIGDPMQAETSHQHGGYSFTSKNKKQELQARLDGFTFSIYAPYERWETFRKEARRLWELYRSAIKVKNVTRVALRYINRIDIPGSSVELENYVRTLPQVPNDMPNDGDQRSFFMQLQLWQDDIDCMLIINEAPVAPPNGKTTSIQLDFDLYREQFEEPWQANDDVAIWGFLEQLHDRKNEAFEASITDTTRGLIDE